MLKRRWDNNIQGNLIKIAYVGDWIQEITVGSCDHGNKLPDFIKD
jgi:hypothetical protein